MCGCEGWILVFSLGLFGLSSAAPHAAGSSTHVAIYGHSDYKGRMGIYHLGSTCLGLGSFSSVISSIQVRSGCVELCREDHCHNCIQVRGNIPDLSTLDLNDNVRTIQKCAFLHRHRHHHSEETAHHNHVQEDSDSSGS